MKEVLPQMMGPGHIDKLNTWAAEDQIHEASTRPKDLQALADQTKAAKLALIEAIHGIGDALELFKPKSDEYVRELRAFTSGSVFELKNSLKAFEDIRKFFLSDAHKEEVARLREFVELCERLQKLKECGFLDAVSDTILKLA